MYASGNENLAAVVVGTSTFYDMLSRIEMANRMASYDEELINDILAGNRQYGDFQEES